MRLPSSAILRRAAAMSFSSYGRGGYPRCGRGRGYSAHPSRPPHPNAGAEFVSGDSHLSAERAANDSLRRGGARDPPPPYRQGPHQQRPCRQGPHQQQPYRQGPHQQPPYGYDYGYGYGQQQQPAPHGAVPYNYSHPQQQPPPPGPQQYGYGASNPYFYGHPQPHGRAPGNAVFRPGAPHLTPRLADYRRRWRFAKQRPPHQAERFSVLSYNILADYLAQEHRFLYERISNFILDWNHRKDKLTFEFGLWNPDILCLQEVDKFTDLEQELARREYSSIWKMRTGNAAEDVQSFGEQQSSSCAMRRTLSLISLGCVTMLHKSVF